MKSRPLTSVGVETVLVQNGQRLPEDLRHELRRLLAQMLVNDYRQNPPDSLGGIEVRVKSRSALDTDAGDNDE